MRWRVLRSEQSISLFPLEITPSGVCNFSLMQYLPFLSFERLNILNTKNWHIVSFITCRGESKKFVRRAAQISLNWYTNINSGPQQFKYFSWRKQWLGIKRSAETTVFKLVNAPSKIYLMSVKLPPPPPPPCRYERWLLNALTDREQQLEFILLKWIPMVTSLHGGKFFFYQNTHRNLSNKLYNPLLCCPSEHDQFPFPCLESVELILS